MSKFTFQDKLGVEWDLSLDLASAEAIDKSDYSQVTDIEFVFLTPDKEFFAELFANKKLAAALAYTIVKQTQLDKLSADIEKYGVSTDEGKQILFARRLGGAALRDMHRAMLESVADFFPEMQTALSSLINNMDKVNKRLQTEVEALDKQMESYLDSEMDKALAEAKKQMPELERRLRGETSIAH